MFLTLLAVTFVISLLVSWIVARIFAKPIDDILQRIISDLISKAWVKYLNFAIYVVGISSGVRVWELERYMSPQGPNMQALELNRDRWVLEVYKNHNRKPAGASLAAASFLCHPFDCLL